jgi:His-Xaa-Ser system radical SAM maturase HxsB
MPAAFQPDAPSWQLLPFQFDRFDSRRLLLTNMVGEHLFVSESDLEALIDHRLPADSPLVRRLRAKHIIREADDELPLELLALKTRTRYSRLTDFTALHIFVVSLRCEHSCPYCQVSRQSTDKSRFDMSPETAAAALHMVFKSPSPQIKIEFQGGEPLLNFGLVEQIVTDAERLNKFHGKDLSFVIATNLALLDDHVIRFCEQHGVFISTSLDGPADLHNTNRPRPGGDSWERTIDGIRRIRAALGPDRVSALMTTTRAGMDRVRETIDCYVDQGFHEIFLRPLSPYGYAIKTKAHAAYDAARWLAFYEEGLDYILEVNARGTALTELYAAVVLKKMLTNEDPGYVDLASPSRIGIGAVVYNYDGDVYASDESRMLAEMGDKSFRLGNVHDDSYAEIMLSDALLDAIDESFTLSAPMCTDCAFESFCGADPVFHHATTADSLGRKPSSAFCQRNMGIFRLLLRRYDADPAAREVFLSWAGR